jgi:uncharacterized protein YidB (DUF937 family)
MGLLDDVIRGALGSQSGTAGANRGGGSILSSPIAMALMTLLASRVLGGGSGARQAAVGSSPGAGGLGGLGGLIDQFRQNGLEDAINSWIGTGPNQPVSAGQLHRALGQNTVENLSEQTGLSQDDLLAQLSQLLPGVVDKLTPNGRLPAASDLLPGPR